MLIHVLDALGLTILKLEVLHARRALNEAHAQTHSNDGDTISFGRLIHRLNSNVLFRFCPGIN
jgi:hypothetical protein